MSINSSLHKSFCQSNEALCDWYFKKKSGLALPVYSSYDIRDSGYKVANVDGNIYPAGFNNICPTDKETAVDVMANYLKKHYGTQSQKILLVTEMHTANAYYWENVLAIKALIENGGRKVLIAFPKKLSEPLTVQSATGVSVPIVSAFEDDCAVGEFAPDLVISNNDFSDPLGEWAQQVTLPVNPPRELGWYQRKKSNYFKWYNQIVEEFASVAKADPFSLNVRTELFSHFDMTDDDSMKELAALVDRMAEDLKKEYSKRDLDVKPTLFIKNNSGTYGLGVVRVTSGQDVLDWNYQTRKKMKAAKGGRSLSEVIVQEGIPSLVKAGGSVAEPVIYMIGCELAGGFLRTHSEKSETESLNSPGAVYKKLCVSDLQTDHSKFPLENVYGWSARLGVLAIGLEAQEMKVEFRGYQR